MDTVIRTVVVYVALLVIFRLAGKRTLTRITTFDFILLLIIGDTVQTALLDGDDSLSGGLLVVVSLVAMDVAMSLIKQRSKTVEKLVDGVPVVIVANGEMIKERADKERIDEADVLQEAREQQGITRLDQIQYAVLERSGGITIIPKDKYEERKKQEEKQQK